MAETDSANNGLEALLPHRPPMLLLHRLVSVDAASACAEVEIHRDVPFFIAGQGVPAWIGLEYMGQCAALIAGYQQQRGLTAPHLGFLLGSRRFTAHRPWFVEGSYLRVSCAEEALVGQSLARFRCRIELPEGGSRVTLAEASLSVLRRESEGA